MFRRPDGIAHVVQAIEKRHEVEVLARIILRSRAHRAAAGADKGALRGAPYKIVSLWGLRGKSRG